MSVEAIKWAMDAPVPSSTHFAVLVVLANFADEEGTCWPSQATISARSKCSPRTVRRTLTELEDGGFISRIEQRRQNGSFTTDRFRLHVRELPNAVSASPKKQPSAKMTSGQNGHRQPAAKLTSGQIDQRPKSTPPAAKLAGPIEEPSVLLFEPIKEPSIEMGVRPLFSDPTPEPPKMEKPKKPPSDYPPAFESIWKSWPSEIRSKSDKRTAAARYREGLKRFTADQIAAAARKYLAETTLIDTPRGQPFKPRTCYVEVFMNGKLEAAVEAAIEAATQRRRLIVSPDRIWVWEDNGEDATDEARKRGLPLGRGAPSL